MAESWVRLWAGMTTDPKFRTISRKSGHPVIAVIALYCHLLLIANESDTRGNLDRVDIEDIASALDMDEEVVESILKAMQGRVIRDGRLSGWNKRQPIREDSGNDESGAKSSTQRVRDYRERKRGETTCNAMKRGETQGNAPEAEAEAEKTSEVAHASAPSTSPSPTGAVCARLKSECRITDVNPGHPKLLALLKAGLTEDELVSAGQEAHSKGKGFAYALAVAEGRRRDADAVGNLPQARASPSERSKIAAARTFFGTGIEGKENGRIIDVTPEHA